MGATGVVFGDIGTSPIYALKETLHTSGAQVDDIYGVVSLFFWTLTLVVSVKYLPKQVLNLTINFDLLIL